MKAWVVREDIAHRYEAGWKPTDYYKWVRVSKRKPMLIHNRWHVLGEGWVYSMEYSLWRKLGGCEINITGPVYITLQLETTNGEDHREADDA